MNKELKVSSFRDLMNGHPSAEIIDVINNAVVRTLTATTDEVTIQPAEGDKVIVPIDMAIVYEPWCLDRGSMLFSQDMKICTEADLIRFPNGDQFSIMPNR